VNPQPSDRNAAGLAELVARAAGGDRDGYAALVRHYQRPLFGFLGRLGLRQCEAEDIAQEAFVRAWQHIDRYRAAQGAFSTWLYTIARRLALNEIDRAARRLHEASDSGLPETACERAGPAQALHAQRQRAALQAALRRIPAADRCVLALAHVHELSLADIAQIEGCSAAAIKARLHRARQRLRSEMTAFDLAPLE
jgi:RNA polymerase sigma-70 factor (ECF subfamily)